MHVAFFVMGEETDEDAPVVVALRMDPGAITVRHSHPCERVEIIVSGTLIVDGVEYGAGDVMTAKPDEFYGPHVAGPEGCLTYEIFSNLAAVSRTTYDTASGPVTLEMSGGCPSACGRDRTIKAQAGHGVLSPEEV